MRDLDGAKGCKGGKGGEAPAIEAAKRLVTLYRAWEAATTVLAKARIWHEVLQ